MRVEGVILEFRARSAGGAANHHDRKTSFEFFFFFAFPPLRSVGTRARGHFFGDGRLFAIVVVKPRLRAWAILSAVNFASKLVH